MINRCLLLMTVAGLALPVGVFAEDSGSLLGKPVTALIGSLDKYDLSVSQPKDGKITAADARQALEQSELIDPTLPIVRHNAFPHQATVTLTRKDNPEHQIQISLDGLGLYHDVVTYVFRYKLPDKRADNLLPQNENGNFVLYVSNQSFAQTPVDITIHIDGKKAISSEFDVRNQHNWIKHSFKLTPGTHNLVAVSDKGDARIEKSFEIKDEKHWAVIDYWYYPIQHEHGKKYFKQVKHFSFDIQNKPIQFQ